MELSYLVSGKLHRRCGSISDVPTFNDLRRNASNYCDRALFEVPAILEECAKNPLSILPTGGQYSPRAIGAKFRLNVSEKKPAGIV